MDVIDKIFTNIDSIIEEEKRKDNEDVPPEQTEGIYTYLGMPQCHTIDRAGWRCTQPIYGGGKLCYYCKKVKDGLIAPEPFGGGFISDK